MIVSTFELLINKRQFPKPKDLPQPVQDQLNLTPKQEDFLEDLSREVIQGYFLTISNLTNTTIELIISFRTVNSEGQTFLNGKDIAALFDVDGNNNAATFVSGSPGRLDYSVELPGNDTGQLIVQANPGLIFNPNNKKELRGYVDIASSNEGNINLLLTPEHRATFYKRNEGGETSNPVVQLDQVAYALPTATGSSMFSM